MNIDSNFTLILKSSYYDIGTIKTPCGNKVRNIYYRDIDYTSRIRQGDQTPPIIKFKKIYDCSKNVAGISLLFSEQSKLAIFQKKISDIIESKGLVCTVSNEIVMLCNYGTEFFKPNIYDKELSDQNNMPTTATYINDQRQKIPLLVSNFVKVLQSGSYTSKIDILFKVIISIDCKNIVYVRFMADSLLIDNTNNDIPNTIYKYNFYHRKKFAVFRDAILKYYKNTNKKNDKWSVLVLANSRFARHIIGYI
jgi:hypothetical protein